MRGGIREASIHAADSASAPGMINGAKMRAARLLSRHSAAYRAARAAHVAYCRLTGGAHMLPSLYVIGFAKCGTTALHAYLSQHPDVAAGFGKEVHFWDNGERYARGLNWYRSHFPLRAQASSHERRTGRRLVAIDSTPRYAVHPHALSRIRAASPDAHFVALVRDPVERAYSHYNMNLSAGPVVTETLPLSDALDCERERTAAEYERMVQDPSYHGTRYFGYSYAEGGLYARWLRPWLETFPGRVMVADSARLASEPQRVLDEITDFAGLARHELADTAPRNVGSYASGLGGAERRRLEEYYEEPDAELRRLLGRDLGWDRARVDG